LPAFGIRLSEVARVLYALISHFILHSTPGHWRRASRIAFPYIPDAAASYEWTDAAMTPYTAWLYRHRSNSQVTVSAITARRRRMGAAW